MLRAGYTFGSYYPGSPIVDLAEEFARTAERTAGFGFRYATNEKIAFEMATAVAIAGGRAFAIMKHVGANVALDSVMAVAYTGQHGALLLIVGDDPGCESSSSVQDTRQMARLLGVPCLEPASLDDLPAAVACATSLSTQLESVVILRLTTAFCHSGAVTAFDECNAAQPAMLRPPLRERRFVVVPANTRMNRLAALRRLEAARALGEGASFWRTQGPLEAETGFVVQNAVFPSFARAIERLGVSPPVFRTLMPWPLSEGAISPFLERHRKIVVVEELDTVLEEQIVTLVQRRRIATEVSGAELWARDFELDEERLLPPLASILGLDVEVRSTRVPLDVLSRGPTFCAGCPHTASIHAIQSLLERLPERPFVSSDIGCYTLAAKKGIEVGDAALAMGSSIGVATGMALNGVPSIALIGDSTFLHAGLPALENAVEQGVALVVCVLENGVAAMTGGQPSVGAATSDRIYAAALGLGAASVTVCDPFEAERTRVVLRERWGTAGVHVIILSSPCALTVKARPRRPVVDEQACTGCGDCVTVIHCPAISLSPGGKFQVDVQTCVGCGFCSRVCPEHALTPMPYERAT
jgi:indolepyruvate ferredoxin oxidoreductase alpha subunit